jgi:hypothetical protein
MQLTKEQYLEQLQKLVGDSTDEQTLITIENFTDTYNGLASNGSDGSNGGEDWKKKYEENDKAWSKKYRDRFFSPSDDNDPPEDQHEDEPNNDIHIDNLFK